MDQSEVGRGRGRSLKEGNYGFKLGSEGWNMSCKVGGKYEVEGKGIELSGGKYCI